MTLLSAGIEIKEKDFSQIIPSVSSSVGAIAGRFVKGPIETPILISSEEELVSIFGPPNDINANEWHTCAEFLKYTNACYVVRSRNAGVLNATSSGTGISVVNVDEYETISSTDSTTAGEFIAKNPGVVGNGLGVIMVDSYTWPKFNTWCNSNLSLFPNGVSLASYFSNAPTTTSYTASIANDGVDRKDELHILILDITGKITGVPYTVLEKYEGVSKASDAVDYRGLSIYYKNVLNQSSNYIWWSNHPTATSGASVVPFGSTAFDVAKTGYTFADINISTVPNFLLQTLEGGADGTPSTQSEIEAAYYKFANKDLYSIDLIMAAAFSVGTPGAIEKYILENVVTSRKDCVGFVSPHKFGAPIRDSVTAITDIINFRASVGVSDNIGSYGFMDTAGFKYIFDRYSKKYRWVPLNGDMAGLAARTDSTNDPWWAFGGFNRGGIKNTLKLAFNPTLAERDVLYSKGINPVIIDSSSGPTLLGDRTMTTKPSAFDRINVRRLFILLEKAISKAAKYMLFEFNDNFTRAQFKNMVEPYLKTIQGKRGIIDFFVRCDGTNNTGDVIDRNEFVAEIYIKPSRSINFITLSFVATRTDVAFSTVVGA